MRTTRTLLLAALLSLWGAAGAVAEPALWRIKGPRSTVYLFGTVHVLPKSVSWRSPRIDAALKAADELWLEAPDADDAAKLQPVIARLGADPAHPLSTRLPAADLPKLDAAAKAMGAPGREVFEPLRPWMVGMVLSVAPLLKAGYDPNSGVEKVVKGEAVAAGKPVKGFETAEGQLHILADMPEAMQVELLERALERGGRRQGQARRAGGQLGGGRRGGDRPLRQPRSSPSASPGAYRRMVVDRNAAWTEALVADLQRPGVRFVAVGAAHLAGPDSVVAMLAKRGVKAERP